MGLTMWSLAGLVGVRNEPGVWGVGKSGIDGIDAPKLNAIVRLEIRRCFVSCVSVWWLAEA